MISIIFHSLLVLSICKGLPVNTPIRHTNDLSNDNYWDELDNIVEINHFDPNWKPNLTEHQVPNNADSNLGQQIEPINKSKSKRKLKSTIKRQTESRAERKKNDPEFKELIAKHNRQYYYNHKRKLKATLTDQQLKQKSIENFKKRQRKYNGFTSKKEQKFNEIKIKIQNNQFITKEDQEYFNKIRAKKAEYQRDYRLRQKINNSLSSS